MNNAVQLSATDDSTQRMAAALLASGVPVGEVAARLEIHRTTLWRWRESPTFRALIEAETRQLLQETREVTRGARFAAIRYLHDLVQDDSARVGDRLAAARAILSGTPAESGQAPPELDWYAEDAPRFLLVDGVELPLPATAAERDDLRRRIDRVMDVLAPQILDLLDECCTEGTEHPSGQTYK